MRCSTVVPESFIQIFHGNNTNLYIKLLLQLLDFPFKSRLGNFKTSKNFLEKRQNVFDVQAYDSKMLSFLVFGVKNLVVDFSPAEFGA